GAVSCPPFTSAAVGAAALRVLLLAMSLCTLLVFGALSSMLWRGRNAELHDLSSTHRVGKLSVPIFLLFSLLLFLYVGGETSISGWIATYVYRFDRLSTETSGLYVSALWVSIVVGRAVTPFLLRRVSEFAVLIAGLISAMTGIAALRLSHGAA